MEAVLKSSTHTNHAARHITRHAKGQGLGLFSPEALCTIDVTIPLIRGISIPITMRGWQLAMQTRGGSP